MFSALFIGLFSVGLIVYLSAGLCENYKIIFYKTRWKDGAWAKKDIIKFGGRSSIFLFLFSLTLQDRTFF